MPLLDLYDINQPIRFGLRTFYLLMRLWWYLANPTHNGAVVAVWLGDRIMMLRHSYRQKLAWPGGSVKKGETAATAACREMREELGLAVDPRRLAFHSRVLEVSEHRRDWVSIFELRLDAAPEPKPDLREVVEANFMTVAEALARPLMPFIRSYLIERNGNDGRSAAFRKRPHSDAEAVELR